MKELNNKEYYKYILKIRDKAQEDEIFKKLLEKDYKKALSEIMPTEDYESFIKISKKIVSKLHTQELEEKYLNKVNGGVKDVLLSEKLNFYLIDELIRL